MTFLAVIFLFSVIILIHEFGHYLMARRNGIQVISFNLGFGPVLLAKEVNGTLYSVRLFPIGGFVQLAGLDEEAASTKKIPLAKRYDSKTIWQKFSVLLFGSLMNIMLAYSIFILDYSIIGIPANVSNRVDMVMQSSPAEKAGLKRGDEILQVNNYVLGSMEKAVQIIKNVEPGQKVKVVWRREGQKIYKEVPVTRNVYSKASMIGIILEPSNYKKISVFKAVRYGSVDTYLYVKFFFLSLLSKDVYKDISGPIGIAAHSAEVVRMGWLAFARFMAILSLNIGLLNLLPLPALDGGRIVFLVYELISRRKPNQYFEKYVHVLGFVILLALLFLVTYRDILKLLNIG